MASRKPRTEYEEPLPPRERSAGKRTHSALRSVSRATLWTTGTIVAILVILLVASFFVDEPIRRSMERHMNESLKGYTVQIPKLHFQLIGLSVTLHDLTVRQQAHPDPPVMLIPRLHASVHWRELVTGHVVGDFLFDHPKVYVNLTQLETERKDRTPVKDKGWQQAFEQIYPLKLNLLRINDADITYIDKDPKRPLHVGHLYFRATNIRNIHSKDRTYPSPIHGEAAIFETGRAVVDGHADFLAERFPGIHATLKVEKVPLDYFRPITERANVDIRSGTLGADGEIEWGPKIRVAHLTDLTLRGIRVDYVHTEATAPAETARKHKVQEATAKASNQPGLLLKVDRFRLLGADIGILNKAKNPPYRAFLSGTDIEIKNLSNHFSEGPATATLRGKFMGSGTTTASATFRPETNGPDFDLKAAIESTDMTKMNDLLQAYGKFDVVQGKFSFFSELHIKDRQITGYVKPLFQDMKVYDKRQDAEKSFFRKAYEALVGGVAHLLQNRQREEVATVADVSGQLGNPRTSTWQVIGRLIENAFIRAILPGFDREVARSNPGKK